MTAARELEITLTARNKEKGQAIPMCGVPYHAAEGYIARLIGKGYRVAICDQMEAAVAGKKLVRREVTRIVTPGTATDAHLLRSHENNYLAAVVRNGARAGVAYVDVSTGEFRATEIAADELPGLLESIGAREVLVAAEHPLFPQPEQKRWIATELEDWVFSADYADRILREHFRLHSLDGCGLAGRTAAIGAAGAVLHYLRDTQRAALDHLDPPRHFDRAENMVLDAVTVRNLELLEPIFSPSGSDNSSTLIAILDQTATGMGGRLMRQRLLRPSLDHCRDRSAARCGGRSGARDDTARGTTQATGAGSGYRAASRQGDDRQRRSARSSRAGAVIASRCRSWRRPRGWRRGLCRRDLRIHSRGLTPCRKSAGRLSPRSPIRRPINISDGSTVRAGYDAELDELRDLSQNGRQFIAQIEARERQRTGIAVAQGSLQ